MKATGALPTEERVQRMNDQQWLWFYLNVLEDEKEQEKKWKHRLDYIGWWINPQLAKSVIENENNRPANKLQDLSESNSQSNENDNQFIVEGDQAINDSFEDELKKALAESDIDENQFTELPDSNSAGNLFESKDDFLSRVIANQSINNEIIKVNDQKNDSQLKSEQEIEFEEQLKKAGIDPDDVDYFEYPEE